uniref:Uncharacterized protein n=1 Tax=Ictidomys tridecemlineatus TaxID=43179 RepID=A0A287DDE9_ICTTR
MKATHRSRWLSKSVSGLSRAGTKRLRRPSNPAPSLKPGSESTVNTAEMYSPGRTSSISRAELVPLACGIQLPQPWLEPSFANMAAPRSQAAGSPTTE